MNEKEETINHSMFQRTVHTVFGQMSAVKGLKKHPVEALAAIIKEFQQLDKGAIPEQMKPVVAPIATKSLTREQKKQALDAVNLIEENVMVELKVAHAQMEANNNVTLVMGIPWHHQQYHSKGKLQQW